MGIVAARPYFVRVVRHERGIPQYHLGHTQRVKTIDERVASHPGLVVAGNSYRGIAVNSVIAEAPGVADRALGFLSRTSGAHAARS
jgi:oxygen-dependent protoporphyrinogen oxidase